MSDTRIDPRRRTLNTVRTEAGASRGGRPNSGSLHPVVRAPRQQSATLRHKIIGQYAMWEQGETVWARYAGRGRYTLERMKRKPAGILKEGLTCVNEIAGVPKHMLELHDVWRSND
jgi:hypothetical protein